MRAIPGGAEAVHIQIKELTGGITNKTYLADLDGAGYVVSLDGSGTDLLGIDRDAELHNSRMAFEYGLGPEVILRLPGVLVTRFVRGKCLPSGTIKKSPANRRVIDLLKRCHSIPVRQVRGQFSVFAGVRNHLAISKRFDPPYPDNLDWIVRQARRIENALKRQPYVPTFCHNDLVPENMLDTGKRIVLIDWEYSGVGDRYFDLGMLAAYHDLNDAEERALLLDYFGTLSQGSMARLKLMRAMSDLRDASWAMIQWAAMPRDDFDYARYGAQRFAHFTQVCHSPRFETWLSAATTTPRLAQLQL